MKKMLSIIFSLTLLFSLSLTSYARITPSEDGSTLYWNGNGDGLDFIDTGITLYHLTDKTDFFDKNMTLGFYDGEVNDVIPVSFTLDNPPDYFESIVENGVYYFYVSVAHVNFSGVYTFLFIENDIDLGDSIVSSGVYVPSSFFDDTVGQLITDKPFYLQSITVDGYTGFKTDDSNTDTPVNPDTPITDTIYVKEDRPFFTTPLNDYTVTEGLLLLLFVITFLNNIFKQHLKGN